MIFKKHRYINTHLIHWGFSRVAQRMWQLQTSSSPRGCIPSILTAQPFRQRGPLCRHDIRSRIARFKIWRRHKQTNVVSNTPLYYRKLWRILQLDTAYVSCVHTTGILHWVTLKKKATKKKQLFLTQFSRQRDRKEWAGSLSHQPIKSVVTNWVASGRGFLKWAGQLNWKQNLRRRLKVPAFFFFLFP